MITVSIVGILLLVFQCWYSIGSTLLLASLILLTFYSWHLNLRVQIGEVFNENNETNETNVIS